jgi:hypothetical protein
VSLISCFPSRSDKVTIFLHCGESRMWCYFSIVSKPFKCCAQGTDRRHSEANLCVKCSWVSDKLKVLKYQTAATLSSVNLSGQTGSGKSLCGFLLFNDYNYKYCVGRVFFCLFLHTISNCAPASKHIFHMRNKGLMTLQFTWMCFMPILCFIRKECYQQLTIQSNLSPLGPTISDRIRQMAVQDRLFQ